MKRILKRRTEITIETHQTIICRARVARGTDDTPSRHTADNVPEVLLFSDELLPEPGVQPLADGEVDAMDEDYAIGMVKSLSPSGLAFELAPTAAMGSISGRVSTTEGRGIGRAMITLTALDVTSRIAISNPFGFYRFDDVSSGQTYFLNIRSKQYVFVPDSRVINVVVEVTNLDWTAANLLGQETQGK